MTSPIVGGGFFGSSMPTEVTWVSCPCCDYEYTLVEKEETAQDAQNYCKRLAKPKKKRRKVKGKNGNKAKSKTTTAAPSFFDRMMMPPPPP